MAVALFTASGVIRRALELRRAWNSGLTAEARCLRTYTTTSGGSGDSSVRTTLHHVYEFTARDGRTIRFEEGGGPATTIEGDIVVVHYSEGERGKATAHRPSHVRNTFGTAAVLAFLSVVVVFCVGFMVTYTVVFRGRLRLPGGRASFDRRPAVQRGAVTPSASDPPLLTLRQLWCAPMGARSMGTGARNRRGARTGPVGRPPARTVVRGAVPDPSPGGRGRGGAGRAADGPAAPGAEPHVGVLLDNTPEYPLWLSAAALAGAAVAGDQPHPPRPRTRPRHPAHRVPRPGHRAGTPPAPRRARTPGRDDCW